MIQLITITLSSEMRNDDYFKTLPIFARHATVYSRNFYVSLSLCRDDVTGKSVILLIVRVLKKFEESEQLVFHSSDHILYFFISRDFGYFEA